MFGGDESREHIEPAATNRKIMKATAEGHATHLAHAQAAPLGAVLIDQLFEHHDSMRDALQMIVLGAARAIVEHQHRAVMPAEELLEREHLTTVTQRVLRNEPQL